MHVNSSVCLGTTSTDKFRRIDPHLAVQWIQPTLLRRHQRAKKLFGPLGFEFLKTVFRELLVSLARGVVIGSHCASFPCIQRRSRFLKQRERRLCLMEFHLAQLGTLAQEASDPQPESE